MPHFATDPGPLAPADLAQLARRFGSVMDLSSECDRRIHRWLSAQVTAAYGVRANGADVQAPPSRWGRLAATSPSGKALYRCGQCGRDSVSCDRQCPAGCGDQS